MKKLISAFLLGLLAVASIPAYAEPASTGPKVYVPIGDANQVLVIDARTDAIIARIPGTEAAHGLAADPRRNLLIVGSYAEADEGVSGTPAKPKEMAEDEHAAHHAKKSETLLKAKDAKSYVTIIRTDNQKVVRRITVPGAVHHVATTPDGSKAILTHPNTNEISIIDLESFRLVKRIVTGDTPNYAVAANNNNTVYVSNAGNNTVSEIDLRAGIVRRNFVVGEGPEHMVLSADGNRLYIANVDGGTVSELAIDKGEVSRNFTVGGGLHGIDLSEDGKRLFVVGRETNKLVAFDLSTGSAQSSSLAPQPYHLKTIPGTGKLYVSSAEQDKIWVVDEQTLKVTREIAVPDRAHQMAVF